MSHRLLLLSLAICLLLPSCAERVWSRQELVEWYNEYEPIIPNLQRFGYAGSDARYHHFVTRSVDDFVMPRVPRDQITIQDERRHSDLGSSQFYFYLVDPKHNFRKIPGDTGIKR